MATRNIVPAYEPPRQRMMSDGSIVDANGKVIYRPSGPAPLPQDTYKTQVGNAAQRQAEVATTKAPTASNPLQRARDAANDPRLQLQQDRLKLQQQKFADQQRRDAEKRRAAKEKGKAKPKPASGGRGGGGRGSMTPEQKAREKARERRQTDREIDKDIRRDNNEWARKQMDESGRPYRDFDDWQRAQDRKKLFNRGRDNQNTTTSQQNSMTDANTGKTVNIQGGESLGYKDGKPYNFNTGEYIKPSPPQTKSVAEEREAAEKAVLDKVMNGIMATPEEIERWEKTKQSSAGPKMVKAYGNRYAKVYVKARGDLSA
jgi:hypothetical protein